MSHQPSTSGVEVRLGFFPLAFLLLLCKPVIEIDGSQPMRASWGTTQVPVAPGRHQIVAYCPYLFFRRMGEAAIVIDVLPGQVVQASWSAPWLVFLPGKWNSTSTANLGAAPTVQAMSVRPIATATPTAPAGWHPDPYQRYQLRYWDGQTWTAHVSTNGTGGVDPAG